MIQPLNSAQSVNFNGRLTSAAVNHLKTNAMHYVYNGVAFTASGLSGKLNSVEGVMVTKLFADALEATVTTATQPRGWASLKNPVTNTCLWAYKGLLSLLYKVV
ncbi:MAG: hypothetical protein K6A44_06295 [bacterium]|nr:hypothetical protein [bacterium]